LRDVNLEWGEILCAIDIYFIHPSIRQWMNENYSKTLLKANCKVFVNKLKKCEHISTNNG
jgi:hypothetical protein